MAKKKSMVVSEEVKARREEIETVEFYGVETPTNATASWFMEHAANWDINKVNGTLPTMLVQMAERFKISAANRKLFERQVKYYQNLNKESDSKPSKKVTEPTYSNVEIGGFTCGDDPLTRQQIQVAMLNNATRWVDLTDDQLEVLILDINAAYKIPDSWLRSKFAPKVVSLRLAPEEETSGEDDQQAEQTIHSVYGVDVPGDADALWLLKNAGLFVKVKDRDILGEELRKLLKKLSRDDVAKFLARVEKETPPAPPKEESKAQRTEEEQFLLNAEPTDLGNALCVQKLFGRLFAINSGMGLMFFDGRRWISDNASAMLTDAVVKTLKRRAKLGIDEDRQSLVKNSVTNAGRINACKNLFMSLPELYVPVEEFDKDKHLFNCWNGTVNLKTGKLQKHNPADHITHITTVSYYTEATCPAWLTFLSNTIDGFKDADGAMADFVQMSYGYSITGETKEQKMFYLFGKKGRNGKGTQADAIQITVGSYATGCSFNTLTRRRDEDQGFDLAALRGARIVFTSESGKETKMNEESVKFLSGEDTIRAALKGKDSFDFKPRFKVWAMSNHKPKGDTTDDSFWGRWHMINFPYSFYGKEDKNLRDKLSTQESLEGILAWIVKGAVKWYNSPNGLVPPNKVTQMVQDTRDEQDSVRAWVKAATATKILTPSLFDEKDKRVFTTNEVLYASYQRWCHEEEREDLKTPDAFGKYLSKMGFEKGKNPHHVKRDRGYFDIRPLTDEEIVQRIGEPMPTTEAESSRSGAGPTSQEPPTPPAPDLRDEDAPPDYENF